MDLLIELLKVSGTFLGGAAAAWKVGREIYDYFNKRKKPKNKKL